ncbi:MAG TPA: protein arginine kinase [Firmicutes bacterium]|nr:protein arginine kinase [Bacillota bacterium]
MSLREIMSKTLSEWMKGTGPESDIVISSRVRLARNLEGIPFPGVAGEEQLKTVVEKTKEAAARQPLLAGADYIRLVELPVLERQLLVEKHLISPQHTKDVKYKAVVVRDDEALSIMVNEEDHLRFQALYPGLQPEEAWRLCSRIDEGFASLLPYAVSPDIGYLTACPTNVGTGMRASIMIHLPALTMADQMKRLINAVAQVGLVVRGIYGEGTEVLGNIFQISNQVTLGRTEDEIIQHLLSITRQIIDQERQARRRILQQNKVRLEDKIFRSLGLLTNARIMSSQEAMQLISDVRLGIDMKLISGLEPRILQELLVMIRPAHLQKLMGHEMEAPERDIMRATLIRERMKPHPAK